MNIGVYFPEYKPNAGGASSLLKTIQKEIKASDNSQDNFFFLYDGSPSEPLTTIIQDNIYINLNFYTKISFLKKVIRKIKNILGLKINTINRFNKVAKEYPIDLFWFPSPVEFDLDYPYIYTVWDLGHRRTPYFPEVSRTGWLWEQREKMYQKMLYKASYVITGNEEGKKEILENYPMPENKIRISPFPVADFCKGEEIKPEFAVPDNFFIYPAQFWPHKNHICILEALKILKENFNINTTVFLTGSDKGNKSYINNKIIEYGLEDNVKFTGFLKDEELKYLYTHATGMIFASLMGPNNMPPIEATYLKCPVIITDLDGHKEQLKNSALYFNGLCPEELANNMKLLLSSIEKQNEIKKLEASLALEFEKINYFENINQIFNEFRKIRKTWGEDYIHL